jgi:hypothetical protein
MITDTLVEHRDGQADYAIKSTRRSANDAPDSLSGSMWDIRSQAVPLLSPSNEQLSMLAQRGIDAVRDSSHQLRDKGRRCIQHGGR